MLRPAVGLAKLSGVLSRALGRGGGTTLPGRVLQAIDGSAIGRLAGQLSDGTVVISATNGKTTTANMVAEVLRDTESSVVHNTAGANLASGVATALLDATTAGSHLKCDLGLFEVDEAALPQIVDQLNPRVLLLGNLFRDQLDRYGELEHVAALWSEVVVNRPPGTCILLCGDDPLVASLAQRDGGVAADIIYFGLDDPSQGLPNLQHAADSKMCPACGARFEYRAVYVGHLGEYACPNCDRVRPKLDVYASRVELDGMRGSRLTIHTAAGEFHLELPLPGLYNVYNALAAAACCTALGIDPELIERGLARFSAAFGRAETLKIGDRSTSILLIKNPTGANEVLRTLGQDGGDDLDLLIALNDGIADGRDISWVWDADFEQLADRVASVVCTGTRAEEMAVRLKYAGFAPESLIVRPDLEEALDLALARDAGRPLYVLPTYTALLELQGLLTDRGHARHYWDQDGGSVDA